MSGNSSLPTNPPPNQPERSSMRLAVKESLEVAAELKKRCLLPNCVRFTPIDSFRVVIPLEKINTKFSVPRSAPRQASGSPPQSLQSAGPGILRTCGLASKLHTNIRASSGSAPAPPQNGPSAFGPDSRRPIGFQRPPSDPSRGSSLPMSSGMNIRTSSPQNGPSTTGPVSQRPTGSQRPSVPSRGSTVPMSSGTNIRTSSGSALAPPQNGPTTTGPVSQRPTGSQRPSVPSRGSSLPMSSGTNRINLVLDASREAEVREQIARMHRGMGIPVRFLSTQGSTAASPPSSGAGNVGTSGSTLAPHPPCSSPPMPSMPRNSRHFPTTNNQPGCSTPPTTRNPRAMDQAPSRRSNSSVRFLLTPGNSTPPTTRNPRAMNLAPSRRSNSSVRFLLTPGNSTPPTTRNPRAMDQAPSRGSNSSAKRRCTSPISEQQGQRRRHSRSEAMNIPVASVGQSSPDDDLQIVRVVPAQPQRPLSEFVPTGAQSYDCNRWTMLQLAEWACKKFGPVHPIVKKILENEVDGKKLNKAFEIYDIWHNARIFGFEDGELQKMYRELKPNFAALLLGENPPIIN